MIRLKPITFDFSGVEKFWKITKKLMEDKKVSDIEWNELVQTPGYNSLITNEFPEDFFIKNFTLVFAPGNENEIKRLRNTKMKQYLDHYLKIKRNYKTLKTKIKKLRESVEKQSKDILEKVYEWLPDKEYSNSPVVSFAFFARDGRGYDVVTIDPLFALEIDDLLPSFMAHELHHFYRNQILAFDSQKVEADELLFVNVINQLQAEGMADLIDKYLWLEKQEIEFIEKYTAAFRKHYNQAPEIIREMDLIITTAEQDLANIREIGEKLQKVMPMSGHPVGYFMVKQMLKLNKNKHLVEHVGNPFEYLRMYNKIALENPALPAFSNKTIDILEKIEEKYVKE